MNRYDNKIIYTNKIFKWIKYFKNQKHTLVITPLTKLSDLFNFKKDSPLLGNISDIVGTGEILNTNLVFKIIGDFNQKFGEEIMEASNDLKIYKNILKIDEEQYINQKNINTVFEIFNKYASTHLNIVVADILVNDKLYDSLSISKLVTNFHNCSIGWSNLDLLVFIDEDFEVEDKDKLLSWLENKTKTVLLPKDIDDFFNNKETFNSYLIDRALKLL